MGRQIIKSPDGRYNVFSTSVDAFLLNAPVPRSVLAKWLFDEATKDLKKDIREQIDRVDKEPKPYYQFTYTYKEALAIHKKTCKKNGWEQTL